MQVEDKVQTWEEGISACKLLRIIAQSKSDSISMMCSILFHKGTNYINPKAHPLLTLIQIAKNKHIYG